MTDILCSVSGFKRNSWRSSRWFGWMGSPFCYALGMPLMAVVSLSVSLFIPRFITPEKFGAYVLLLDLFRYAMRSDLGLTQLADRRIAGGRTNGKNATDEADLILAARWRLGVITLMVVTPVAMTLAALSSTLAPIDAGLAIAAGAVAMVAGGPSSIYRARGDIWMYTALSFAFSVGFIVPRLVGIIFFGTTGCFAFLLIWYVIAAAAFTRVFAAPQNIRVDLGAMIRAALPMFVFAAVWILYLSAGRWVAAVLCEPSSLGLYAFSANLSFTGVTTIGLIADIRYPRWLGRLAAGGEHDNATAIAREASIIAFAVASAVTVLAPLAPKLLHVLFPNYGLALHCLLAMACASVPLSVVAWFLPVVIAATARPACAATMVFAPAVFLLICAMPIGARLGGIEGQAWSYAASACTALLGMSLVLARARILSRRAAFCFFAAPTTAMILPILVVLAIRTAGAP